MGFPKTLISDQGREFNNKVVEEICTLLGLDHRRTSAYHPQTNGLTGTVALLCWSSENNSTPFIVERFNQTLEDMLSKTMAENEEGEWDDLLEDCLFAYRSAKHASTGFSPFFLMFNR